MPATTKTKLFRLNPEAVLFADWVDSALIGICYRADFLPVALYSKSKIYAALAARGMTHDEMTDYYTGSFMSLRAGEFTPVIFDDLGVNS